jgi:CheY-like chemotaxis protein/anti-sigma regulatory factor (Ser/Thr protein kinase)
MINKKLLGIINGSSQNLLRVINDILDFSKIESGNLKLDYVNFNPQKEFNLTKKLFDAKIKEKNINFHISYIDLPEALYADALRIKQVINNLLSNAIKFTDDNKNIYLNIRYKDNTLFVSVKDEGIGISKEYQEKIFEAFSQADSSTTRKYGGTGLGLSISHNLVKKMKGELKLKSTLHQGSEFYFSIPIQIGQAIQVEEYTQNNIKLSGHILLVEDNNANQMFMKIVLKNMNLSFDIANDGIEAIKLFKHSKYDAILMDENMPNMNGIEATKQILLYEKQNNLIHTPIIALTANALKGDRKKFLEAGMDEYITKPVDKKKLNRILGNFLL